MTNEADARWTIPCCETPAPTTTHQQVEQRLFCDHRLEIRQRPDRLGRIRYMQQCVICGERIGQYLPRRDAPQHAPLFDEHHAAARIRQRNAVWAQVNDEVRAAELALWRAEHERYLSTPQWARLRAAVLRRARGRCEGCGAAPAVQVHHLTYKRWQREMLFDLVAVCDACHDQIHEIGPDAIRETQQ